MHPGRPEGHEELVPDGGRWVTEERVRAHAVPTQVTVVTGRVPAEGGREGEPVHPVEKGGGRVVLVL